MLAKKQLAEKSPAVCGVSTFQPPAWKNWRAAPGWRCDPPPVRAPGRRWRRDLGFGIGGAAQAELPVGLAGAEKNIAHQNIVDLLAFAAGAGPQSVRPALSHGGQSDAPLAIGGRARGCGLRAHLHPHIGAGRRLAIDADRLTALQDRMIGEHWM
jgi:hypothetical protein